MNSEEKIKDLSFAFSTIIHSWLTVDEIKEVVYLNNSEGYVNYCATYNFCDASMAIFEAFQTIFNREPVMFNNSDTDFLNKAWDLSKINNFSIVL